VAKRTEHSEHRTRGLRSRALNFAGHWILAAGFLAVCTLSRLFGGGDPVRTPFVTLGELFATVIVAGFAYSIAAKERKRHPLVVVHTTGTAGAAGVALIVTTIIGFPAAWIWVLVLGCATGALTWNLRRFDVLRADPREPGDSEDSLAKAVGLAKTQVGRPDVHANRVEIPLKHRGGETVTDAQSALPKIEAVAGTLPGRSRVVRDPDDASKSKMILTTKDELKHWTRWPGPAYPGQSFALPFHIGVYEDGEVERYWHVAGDDRPANHVGRMGMTRSGKTGNALVMLADAATRTDVVILYADCAKGGQSVGPIRPAVTLYADSQPKVKALFEGVERMVADRANRLGEHGFRDWSPDCYTRPDLRMPAVLLHLDEADDYIGSERFTRLCKASLSVGVYISVTLPRADHVSMPTTARFSIGQWLCFGTGDSYSAEFALSEQTIAAGAHPELWKNRRQGYHYLDGAPGVDEDRYPMPARSYGAQFDQLELAVAAGTRWRAHLPDYDIAALGKAWMVCQPNPGQAPLAAAVYLNATGAVASDGTIQTDAGEDREDEEMPPMPLPDADDPDEAREDAARYAALDPSQPIPPPPGGDGIDFGGDLPEAPSNEAANKAFDDLLRRMALVEGKAEVTVAELVDRFPYRSRNTIARRLTAMCDPDNPEVLFPPGIALERTDKATRFVLHVLAPTGAGGGGNGNGG
jgi:hypothetical protein